MLDLPFTNELFNVVIEKGTVVNVYNTITKIFRISIFVSLQLCIICSHTGFHTTAILFIYWVEGCVIRGQRRSMES